MLLNTSDTTGNIFRPESVWEFITCENRSVSKPDPYVLSYFGIPGTHVRALTWQCFTHARFLSGGRYYTLGYF